jgi:hypothetical protein
MSAQDDDSARLEEVTHPPSVAPSLHLPNNALPFVPNSSLTYLAPQISPLVLHRAHRRRRKPQARRERDAAVHRSVDGAGVGADTFVVSTLPYRSMGMWVDGC